MTPLRDAAESATAGVPVVRGLEWHSLPTPMYSQAETVVGRYLTDQFEGRWLLWLPGQSPETHTPLFHNSHAEHRAAAQADYEQRIKSALSPDFLSELDTARAEIERLNALLAEMEAWEPISSAPRDGSTIQITNGKQVHAGAWNPEVHGPARPWVIFEGVQKHTVRGCCDYEDEARISCNGWFEDAPTHWRYLSDAPARATLSPVKENDRG